MGYIHKEIQIGEGSYGNSAIVYFEYPEIQNFVSKNAVSYWCTDEVTGAYIKIMKDTNVGAKLTRMIENREGAAKIKEFLAKIVLKRLTVGEFQRIISGCQQSAFDEGMRTAQQNMRKALGLR